jgi:aerobic-type carbon monoxide dehydrogenase small subunit (CoxS/CutS family)
MKHQIQVTVNGRQHNFLIDSQRTLLEVVRDELKLFGARESCGMSLCGACTVLIDDVPVSSCSYLAARAEGKSILTVEGLGTAESLDPVQRAFLKRDGLQCSYCTPGMVLMTVALLRENPSPTVEEIKDYLSGNLCRCTAYPEIIESVLAAAKSPNRPEPRT